jgi:hypothetical protein
MNILGEILTEITTTDQRQDVVVAREGVQSA